MQIYVLGIHEIQEVRIFNSYERALEAVRIALASEICVLDITLQRFVLKDDEWTIEHDYDLSDVLSDIGSVDGEEVSVIDSDEEETDR